MTASDFSNLVLLPREFSIASGELSATLKVKRPVVKERYRAQIEEMFSNHAPEQSGPLP